MQARQRAHSRTGSFGRSIRSIRSIWRGPARSRHRLAVTAVHDDGDHGEAERDRQVDEGREEHLGADERQQHGEALPEVAKPLDRAGEQEVKRAQAEHREGVGGEHDEQVPGHAEDRRDRVQREHHVGHFDGHESHQQRRGHDLAAGPGEEPAAVVSVADRQEAAQAAHDEVLPRGDGIARAEHADPGQQDQRAEGVEDPAQMLNERTAGGNEAAPEHERAHHPEVEHPALQRGRDRERGKQQHEDEDVVDAERFLQQVTGEILTGGALAPPQPQKPAEGEPGRDPQAAQHRGGAQAVTARIPGDDQIHRDERGEDGERYRPGPGHRDAGRHPAAEDGRGMAGSAQRGQYRVSGTTVSSPAGMAAPHCSQRPKPPAVSRARASSTSASFRRATTVLRSSRSISRWPPRRGHPGRRPRDRPATVR